MVKIWLKYFLHTSNKYDLYRLKLLLQLVVELYVFIYYKGLEYTFIWHLKAKELDSYNLRN